MEKNQERISKIKKIYLAAAWAERDRARFVRSMLCAAGFAVNARWLDQEDNPTGGAGEFAVSVRWLDQLDADRVGRAVVGFDGPLARRSSRTRDHYAECAEHDLEDIRACDALVTLAPSGPRIINGDDENYIEYVEPELDRVGVPWESGGRHVELGYALGRLKPAFVLGGPENVFQTLNDVTWCDGLTALVIALHREFSGLYHPGAYSKQEVYGDARFLGSQDELLAHPRNCRIWRYDACDCVLAVAPFKR